MIAAGSRASAVLRHAARSAASRDPGRAGAGSTSASRAGSTASRCELSARCERCQPGAVPGSARHCSSATGASRTYKRYAGGADERSNSARSDGGHGGASASPPAALVVRRAASGGLCVLATSALMRAGGPDESLTGGFPAAGSANRLGGVSYRSSARLAAVITAQIATTAASQEPTAVSSHITVGIADLSAPPDGRPGDEVVL